ncbi:MAG: SoxR reducing system RseC family protein [Firmicutes bacterium]|nr:SoxR reducing system RseC family protein [Bacillota bacterium]MCR4711753.1 SoxR reducing system RseC family protein [Clostridia bacterium]
MALKAKVTDVLTTGFAEVDLIGDDFESLGEERCIAQFEKKVKVHRGDYVELVLLPSRRMTEARIAYIIPLICFAFGVLVTKTLGWGERILSGVILAVMAFVVSWLMNRRARLLQRQEYEVVRVIKEDPNHL